MELKQKAVSVRMVIDRKVDVNDLLGLTEKLNDLINISGLAAENTASSKLAYRKDQESVILELMDNPIDLPVSTLNDLIKGKTADSESMMEYCDRLDRKLSHAIDGLRSILSLKKMEMEKSIDY